MMAEHPGRPSRRRVSSREARREAIHDQSHIDAVVSATGSCYQTDIVGSSLAAAVLADVGGSMSIKVDVAPQQILPETEEEEDLYTWCDQCGMNTIGDCFIHGKVITVADNKLPSRARLSLPSILTLKKIRDDEENNEEKEGVFAKRQIKPRTQFGPVEAPPLQGGVTLPSDIFDVRVLKPGQQECLDLTQEEACNWMMFVRPAQNSQESNLAAYQQHDHVYYIATKTIQPNAEMRVWYLKSYGMQFGKQPLPSSLPPLQTYQENIKMDDLPNTLEDQEPSVTVIGTRAAAVPSSDKLLCGLCNAPFSSLPQLVAHNCRALDELPPHDTAPRQARRKGRPRKMTGTGKRGKAVTRGASNTSTLPSVNTLIKTEVKAEVAVPDSTVSDLQQEPVPAKKRGRPRGSRNKPLAEGEVKPPRKPSTNVKRKRPRLDCTYCDRSFYSEEQHLVHEAEHTGRKPYVCHYPNCGKGFGSKFKYWRHSLIHEQPQNRKCPYCDRSFNRVDHLKNHVATHSSNRQMWSCLKCGKQYLYRSTFIYHMALHDAKEGTDLICRICALEFTDREDLVHHIQTHNRYKPDLSRSKNHECPKCRKKFTTSKDVRRHMVTHTKDRSFLCEFCPQTFARKDHLKRHYKSNHKAEVLEQAASNNIVSSCQICLKPLNSEKHLQYHMRTAHGEGEEAATVSSVKTEKGAKQPSIMQVIDPDGSKILVMPDACQVQQQQRTQQQLSLLTQSTATAGAVHPVQIHINQHNQQQTDPGQQQQQQQNLLQAGPFITNLPAGSGGQAVEVVADGNDHFNSGMLTLKTIPYRFPSGQVLASVQSNQTTTPQVPTASSLRQILNYTQPHQQAQASQQQQEAQPQLPQQVTQPQQTFTQSEVHDLHPTPTIVSMLSAPRGDSFIDLTGKGQAVFAQDTSGQLKAVPTQWVLAGNTPALPDSSSGQAGSDTGDHCYATGGTGSTTAANDVGLKLSALPSLGGKVIGSLPQIPDIDTLRLLQSCQTGGLGLGTAVSANSQSVPTQSAATGSSSGLQASWDTLSDLVTIPLSDIMTPLSGSQTSVINLPVTVSIADGTVSVSAPVTLSQAS